MTDLYRDPDAPVQPDQFAAEFGELLNLYEELQPRCILEIGVREGGTLYQWMKHTRPGALIVAIDLPGVRWGNPRKQPNVETWQAWAAEFGHEIHVYFGNSQWQEAQFFAGKYSPFDFVFLDADHTYEGVKSDFKAYGLMARAGGGVVAIHDILPDDTDELIQVGRFWEELKAGLTWLEYTSGQVERRGIGVVYV